MTTYIGVIGGSVNTAIIGALSLDVLVTFGIVSTIPWRLLAGVLVVVVPFLYVLTARYLARRSTRNHADRLVDTEEGEQSEVEADGNEASDYADLDLELETDFETETETTEA